MKKIIVSLSFLSLVMFLTMVMSLAMPVCLAIGETPPSPPTGGPSTLADIVAYICNATKWFTIITLILAIFMLIYAGFAWMTAGGDEDKLSNARKWLTYGIVGILVALLAWFLVRVVASFLGVDFVGFSCVPE